MRRTAQRFSPSADASAEARSPRLGGGLAIYVYGIARRDGMAASAAPFVEGIVPGVAVEVLPAADLAVILSCAPERMFVPPVFGADAESVWATERALAHHRVLTNLAMFATIAPMRVGTILPDLDAVFGLLARSGRAFARMLDRVAGTQEWGIRLFADMEICRRVAEDAPAFMPLDVELDAPPQRALTARQRLQDARDQIVRRTLGKRVDTVQRFVASKAREVLRKPLALGAAWNGHGPALLLESAYLVDRADEAEFRQTGQDLAAVLAEEGLNLRMAGPLPPYSFAAIGVDMLAAEHEHW